MAVESHPPVETSTVRLLRGSAEFFPALISALDGARQEARLETYIFRLEGEGVRVAEALERAARRGVAVHLFTDGVGTPTLPAPWPARLRAAGVQWRTFMPLGRFGLLLPTHWRRLHRKLGAVDGTVAFCGGINILDDHFDPNHGHLPQPRLDYAVQVHGALAQQVMLACQELWWRAQAFGQGQHDALRERWQAWQSWQRAALQTWRTGGARNPRAMLMLRDNLRHRSHIERAYRRAIGMARDEVLIANAYFLPGRKLRQALVLAARRGVRVTLLLQGRYEYFFQFHAARAVYGTLLAAGVEIFEYSASFLHAKVAVVDRRWATVGSSNLDPLSLLLAREANVVLEGEAFAGQLRSALYSAMEQQATRVDAAAYAARPWTQRVRDGLALALVRLALTLSAHRY